MISLWTAFWLGHELGFTLDVTHWWDLPFIVTSLVAVWSEGAFELNTVFKYFDKDN